MCHCSMGDGFSPKNVPEIDVDDMDRKVFERIGLFYMFCFLLCYV